MSHAIIPVACTMLHTRARVVGSHGTGGEISKLLYGARDDFRAITRVQPNRHGIFATVVHHILKPGDLISLDWRPGYHDNGYVEHATADWKSKSDHYRNCYSEGSLHVDSCFLIIQRPTKKVYTQMGFEVSINACCGNSARMIDATPKSYCRVEFNESESQAV